MIRVVRLPVVEMPLQHSPPVSKPLQNHNMMSEIQAIMAAKLAKVLNLM